MTALDLIDKLRAFVREEARLSDKSSHEWGTTSKENEAYRAGMWYAYRQVENLIPPNNDQLK